MKKRKVTLRNQLVRNTRYTLVKKVNMFGPYVYFYILNPLGILVSGYIGMFAAMPCLILKKGKWVKFLIKSNEEK